MCGVTGFWGPPDRSLLEAMTEVVAHRGPDDQGYLQTDEASLGFRRLSIIDLEHGKQPMSNEDGTVHVVFNGEIYNFRELRAELEPAGHTFATNSDTEAIVHAYEEWGASCFKRFNGMWAVAILDRRGAAPKLVLGRDHFGIKPLHWARSGERILFASEIKSMLQDRGFIAEPDDQVIYEYLVAGLHDHTGGTFFKGVNQVRAATYVEIDAQGVRETVYWTPRLSTDGDADPATFRAFFDRAVERRLVADVPVGTCLSGGLDSSSIVVTMTRLLADHVPDAGSMGDRLKTFSAVFDNDPIDEREWIEIVLAATGAERNYVRPDSQEFFGEIDEFVWHTEEPIVSTGPYAQWCVMRLAAEKVKVVIDGQGGDELLAGYVPYQMVYLRQLLKERKFATLAREAWAARDVLTPLVKRRLDQRKKAFDVRTLLRSGYVAASTEPVDPRSQTDLKLRLMQDLTRYSLPSLLRYEDRNSMAHSMESRVPFLDQELVEYVFSLPADAIIRHGWSRAIFRDALKGVLPEAIRLRRKKIGFTTPEMRWLKARRAIVQGLFRSPQFVSRKYWDGLAVAEAFRAACNGTLDESMFFWRAINVEIWLRLFFDEGGGDPAAGRYESIRRSDARVPSGITDAPGPNLGRHLYMVAPDGDVYARFPVHTPLIAPGDDLEKTIDASLDDGQVRPGDVIVVSEKAVAISQGRSFPIAEIHPGLLARLLSRFVGRTPVGIGLGMPQTMQLAIEEAGVARIVFATLAAALTRPFGVRGTFYRIAGRHVAAIDGPTPGTIPPYNTHAKKAPLEPQRFARDLADTLTRRFGGTVSAAVIDANDIGADVMGASEGVDPSLIISLFRDNPLGQGQQQTPVAIVRRVG